MFEALKHLAFKNQVGTALVWEKKKSKKINHFMRVI